MRKSAIGVFRCMRRQFGQAAEALSQDSSKRIPRESELAAFASVLIEAAAGNLRPKPAMMRARCPCRRANVPFMQNYSNRAVSSSAIRNQPPSTVCRMGLELDGVRQHDLLYVSAACSFKLGKLDRGAGDVRAACCLSRHVPVITERAPCCGNSGIRRGARPKRLAGYRDRPELTKRT